MNIDRTLLIKEPWISLICSRDKTWEIRRQGTSVREWIGLTASGSGTVQGTAHLKDVHGPYSAADLAAHEDLHQVPNDWLLGYAGERVSRPSIETSENRSRLYRKVLPVVASSEAKRQFLTFAFGLCIRRPSRIPMSVGNSGWLTPC